jgi:hypothetical protein
MGVMSKRVESPVKRWPGYVVLSDPLNFPQVFAIEDAIVAVKALTADDDGKVDRHRADYAWLPAILKCVEEWHLGRGFPEHPDVDTFPATPWVSRDQLLAWLIGELVALFQEAEVPQA